MMASKPGRVLFCLLASVVFVTGAAAADGDGGITSAEYVGTWTVEHFDVSPPLRDITPLLVPSRGSVGGMIPEYEGEVTGPLGPQDVDPLVQSVRGTTTIPAPLVSFDGPPNLFGGAPPDPNGDVGPNHYVAMSNLHFQIFDKAGTSLYGPAANNTLWSGFGGRCEIDNDGDPIVLYDQLDDRWILTQFALGSSPDYNCVAVSTTPDPLGTYYRYAFSTPALPDYPKYGMWPDALYISSREIGVGIGAYAMNRAQIIAGDPSPTVISFLATSTSAGGAYNIGDGLLPSDMDGVIPPPAGSPNYFVGSMDNGGQYGAPQDALTVWEFHADFTTPANSTFVLTHTIPIAPYDTQYPCSPGSRDCIPQPETSNKIDILSYRQRPMFRLAYRNFGDHESLVTNQSVEAAPNIAGMRWWEIRDPGGTPFVYQEGTYAPGVTDGIHRWMGSIAMDSAGNMALGYSASDATSTYPSVWYTGRLAGDPLGTMPQGEGSIVDGTGSQTGYQRWGDYSDITVDPVDDCTFWYVNEYVPVTSSSGWRLRIGAFKFDECGTPDFYLGASPSEQAICAGSNAVYSINVGSISSYAEAVTLGASGQPAGTTAGFAPNPITPPGASTFTVSNTAGATAGLYPITVSGTGAGSPGHSIDVDLSVFATPPPAPTLVNPVNGSVNQPLLPDFQWNGPNASSYTIEVATDTGFTNVVFTATVPGTTATPTTELASNTEHFWRVMAGNPCASSTWSPVYSFYTEALPGDCGFGSVASAEFYDDLESGAVGWALGSGGSNNTWALSTLRAYSGTTSYHSDDLSTSSDQRLDSPAVYLPTGAPPLTLQFWNWQLMEDRTDGCWDGGEVEISTDGGSSWTPLPDAVMLTDPYDGPVTGLGGLDGWCDDLGAASTVWKKAVVDVSSYAGQIVQFRFRLGTDSSVSREGWYIDDVKVQSCVPDGSAAIFADGFESGDMSAWSSHTS
jgi:hypothetical protein